MLLRSADAAGADLVVPLNCCRSSADLRGVLIAQLPVLLQCLGNDLVEFRRQLRIPAGYGFWRFVQYGGKGRADGLTFKWQMPRGHFVNHDSKGEQVGTRVQFLAMHLFWRHEGDGARGSRPRR